MSGRRQVTELRPVCAHDTEFLFRLYSSTRDEELASVPWSVEQKNQFLQQQFTAQTTWWREQYSAASFDIILVDDQAAGRLYVYRTARDHRIVDISLLPQFRGNGIGSHLLQQVIAEASAAGKTTSIHVEAYNPARRLYDRLGFRVVEDKGIYLLMERLPDNDAVTQPNTA